MQLLRNLQPKIKRARERLRLLFEESTNIPLYKIISIEELENDEHVVMVQMTNTSKTLRMKPEVILADDKLTDSFSQRDVRTLTYLGYLGINSPKYKILAKRLLKEDKKLIFALKQKGSKELMIKTAEEISSSEELIKNLDQQDAHMVGFTAGSQTIQSENEIKQRLIQKKSKENKHA